MKSVALHNLGCKVNAYEIDVVQQILQENGYRIVPFDKKADVYIINTCSVTNIADRKSRQMLHRAKKLNPEAVVVAMGCYVQTGKEQIKKDACIDIAIGNRHKEELVSVLEDYFNGKEEKEPFRQETMLDIKEEFPYDDMELKQTAEHTRAYIKIQDGCNQFCSYCIIPYARGKARSRKQAAIVEEISSLCQKGYQEIVLTGIHISSYGLDLEKEQYNASDKKGQALLELITEVSKIPMLKRIRLGSLEPMLITEDFAKALSQNPKICPHFHLSLQSGCDETLKRMNRHYTTKDYEKSVGILKDYFEHPAITTDVIVGFPKETEAEFEQTKAFLEKIGFYEMHIFPYSKREGTPAAKMTGQIAENEKKRRSRILLELDKEQSKAYRSYFIGQTEEVLLEEEKEIDGKRYMIGHTKRYVKVAAVQDEKKTFHRNQMITGEITGILGEMLVVRV